LSEKILPIYEPPPAIPLKTKDAFEFPGEFNNKSLAACAKSDVGLSIEPRQSCGALINRGFCENRREKLFVKAGDLVALPISESATYATAKYAYLANEKACHTNEL
ncbi:hypothetical protein CEXT_596591, partial [Caerostris extrusa]